MANAILELWKKETGSLSSVFIEGTICITSGTGKTTVVQVADKFSGTIPEVEDEFDNSITGMTEIPFKISPNGSRQIRMHTADSLILAPRVECHNQAAMAAFLDNLSPASLVSPNTDNSRSSQNSGSPTISLRKDTSTESLDISVSSIKEEMMSEDSEEESESKKKAESGTGGICPGTGYYVVRDSENGDKNNNEKEKSTNIENCDSKGSDKDHESDCSGKELDENHNMESKDDSMKNASLDSSKYDKNVAIDLTKKDCDLALSSPQSYTAQVRDVIRQRLLAAKSSNNTSSSQIDQMQMPSMLKTLGLHRAGSSDDGPSAKRTKTSPRIMQNGGSMTLLSQLPSRSLLNGSISSPAALPGSFPMSYAMFTSRSNLTNSSTPLQSMLNRKPISPELIGLTQPLTSPEWASRSSLSPPSRGQDYTFHDMSPESYEGEREVGPNGEQRVYRCDYCSKTFLFKSKYHEHLPVHTNARPFQCHLCSRTYKYKYDLRVHLRTHMGIPTKSTVCPFCTAKFDTNKVLRAHIKDAHRDQQKVTEEDCTHPTDHLPPAL